MHRFTRTLLRQALLHNTRCYHVNLISPCHLKTLLVPPNYRVPPNSVQTLVKKFSSDIKKDALPIDDNVSQSSDTTSQECAPTESATTSQECAPTVLDQESEEFPPIVLDHESVLKNFQSSKMTVSNASESVILLASLKNNKEVELMSDDRFLELVKILESPGTGNLAPLAAISTLKSLSELNVPNEAFSSRNLENSLTWMARSCAIKDLVMMLSFSVGRRKTESQEKLYKEICRALERRWVEIRGNRQLEGNLRSETKSPSMALFIHFVSAENYWVSLARGKISEKERYIRNTLPKSKNSAEITRDSHVLSRTFVSLLHYSEHFSDQFMAKLEDRLSEVADELNGEDLTAVLYELARKKRRNLPLLKALTYYLGKNRADLDVKQASDALFALNKLYFKDQEVLEKLCATIEFQVDGVEKHAVVRSILTSLGQLHFLHTGVMERIAEWYNKRREKLDSKDMVAMLMTCANLNYLPQDEQRLIEHISQTLNETSITDHQVWLDVVWSLVVLGRANHQQLNSVLNSDFSTSLLLYSNNNRNIGSQLKLLNINAAATKIFQDYDGSKFNINEDALLKNLKVAPKIGKVKLQQSVLEAFSNLVPPPRFLRLSVNTCMGFVADAECVLDAKDKPLLVDSFSNSFQNSEPQKPLPEGATRLALMVASFQDCNFGGDLGGVASLNVKLAEAAGYKVLVVKFSDMDPSMKLPMRVQKLDKMLKNVLEKQSQ